MKSNILSILTAAFVIAGALIFVNGGFSSNPSPREEPSVTNITKQDGTQIIDLRAKGGYGPRVSIATAGIPTTLRVNTAGTYDCSAAIRIPSLKIAQMLPPNGTTEISLGTPGAGTLRGTCGMGMYNFEIRFQ